MSLEVLGVKGPHEPKSLGVARLVSMVVLVLAFFTYCIIQLYSLIHFTIILRDKELNGELYPPAILMECRQKEFSQSKVELQGVYSDKTGTQVRFELPKWLGPAEYGTSIISGTSSNQAAFVNANVNKTAWQVRPLFNVQFRSMNLPGDPNNIHELWILITVPASSRQFFTGTNVTAVPGVDVRLFPPNVTGPGSLDSSLNETKPLNIYANGWIFYKETRRTDLKSNTNSVLNPYGASYVLPSDVQADFLIRVLSSNTPSTDTGMLGSFSIDAQEAVRSFTWLDFLSGVGGAFTLCSGIYAFLFGIGRLRPWGVIQQFHSRKLILSGIKDDVICRMENSSSNQDTQKADVAMMETNQLAMQQRGEHHKSDINSALGSGRMENATRDQLVQRIHYLEERTKELEGFQDRIETFYTSNDLFYKRSNMQASASQ
ncbi:hypothetical protein BDF19DRAFT_411070 [Syncephalis fuscata]|nr:hypothetical protein BDF19DRAFT_411070 [Syncephalis fuscata]